MVMVRNDCMPSEMFLKEEITLDIGLVCDLSIYGWPV